VLDAYSRKVVGRQLAGHLRTTLVLDALRMALGTRGPGADVALVHHSDTIASGAHGRSSSLAVVEYIGWFNDARLHQALGDRPPSEFERLSQTSTLEISLS
jgi:transposase InsO family protein